MQRKRRGEYLFPSNVLIIKLEAHRWSTLFSRFPDGVNEVDELMHSVEDSLTLRRVGFSILLSGEQSAAGNDDPPQIDPYRHRKENEVPRPDKPWGGSVGNVGFRSNPPVRALVGQCPVKEPSYLSDKPLVIELEGQRDHAIAAALSADDYTCPRNWSTYNQ